jgi:hypothetical protein
MPYAGPPANACGQMLNAQSSMFNAKNAKCQSEEDPLFFSPVHGALPAGALAKAGLDQAF